MWSKLKSNNTLVSVFFMTPIIWVMAFMPITYEGRSIASKLLVIFSLISIAFFKEKVVSFKEKPKEIIVLSLCMLILISYKLVMHLYHGEHFSIIRSISICLLYLYTFPIFLISKKSIINISLFTSTILFFSFFYFISDTGFSRSFGYLNPNEVSIYISMVILFSICTSLYIKNVYIKYIAVTVSISPLFLLALTGSRGAWLSLFISLIIFLFTILRKNITKRKATLIILALTLSVITLSETNLIKKRINTTTYEIETILNSNNYHTSIGKRILILGSALSSINENPWLGNGYEIIGNFKKQYDNKKIPKFIVDFSPIHYHNQYLDNAVRQGIPSMMLFYFLLLYPMYKIQKNTKSIHLKAGIVGLAIIFLTYSLTEVPLRWPFFIYFFFILNLLIIVLNRDSEET